MEDVTLLSGERIDEVNEKIRLIQKKDGLTFGTDAFLLASYIKEQRYARAAELGSGTGIISLLLSARERLAAIYAFEIQPEFAELTERNTRLNGLSDKIKTVLKDIRLLTPADTEGELDVVFTNPPYMLTNAGKANMADVKNIARHEVCGTIGDFCSAARRLLKFGGKFYCVYRPDRLTALLSALAENKLEPKQMTFVHADEDSPPSMVLVCAQKGGAPSLKVTPPLLLHDRSENKNGRPLSEKAQRIYDTMSFWEL